MHKFLTVSDHFELWEISYIQNNFWKILGNFLIYLVGEIFVLKPTLVVLVSFRGAFPCKNLAKAIKILNLMKNNKFFKIFTNGKFPKISLSQNFNFETENFFEKNFHFHEKSMTSQIENEKKCSEKKFSFSFCNFRSYSVFHKKLAEKFQLF